MKTDTVANPDGFVWQVCEHVYSKHLRAKLKPGGDGNSVRLQKCDPELRTYGGAKFLGFVVGEAFLYRVAVNFFEVLLDYAVGGLLVHVQPSLSVVNVGGDKLILRLRAE